ncbi:MAG: hypothetical protein Q9168_005135 [Polycauliona sp. 1 TL-2023]
MSTDANEEKINGLDDDVALQLEFLDQRIKSLEAHFQPNSLFLTQIDTLVTHINRVTTYFNIISAKTDARFTLLTNAHTQHFSQVAAHQIGIEEQTARFIHQSEWQAEGFLARINETNRVLNQLTESFKGMRLDDLSVKVKSNSDALQELTERLQLIAESVRQGLDAIRVHVQGAAAAAVAVGTSSASVVPPPQAGLKSPPKDDQLASPGQDLDLSIGSPTAPKTLIDEELRQQYRIHLATRVRDGKEAKWVDIHDDEDDWTIAMPESKNAVMIDSRHSSPERDSTVAKRENQEDILRQKRELATKRQAEEEEEFYEREQEYEQVRQEMARLMIMRNPPLAYKPALQAGDAEREAQEKLTRERRELGDKRKGEEEANEEVEKNDGIRQGTVELGVGPISSDNKPTVPTAVNVEGQIKSVTREDGLNSSQHPKTSPAGFTFKGAAARKASFLSSAVSSPIPFHPSSASRTPPARPLSTITESIQTPTPPPITPSPTSTITNLDQETHALVMRNNIGLSKIMTSEDSYWAPRNVARRAAELQATAGRSTTPSSSLTNEQRAQVFRERLAKVGVRSSSWKTAKSDSVTETEKADGDDAVCGSLEDVKRNTKREEEEEEVYSNLDRFEEFLEEQSRAVSTAGTEIGEDFFAV